MNKGGTTKWSKEQREEAKAKGKKKQNQNKWKREAREEDKRRENEIEKDEKRNEKGRRERGASKEEHERGGKEEGAKHEPCGSCTICCTVLLHAEDGTRVNTIMNWIVIIVTIDEANLKILTRMPEKMSRKRTDSPSPPLYDPNLLRLRRNFGTGQGNRFESKSTLCCPEPESRAAVGASDVTVVNEVGEERWWWGV
ncbi:hypothetical protein WH47_04398 [Habropoda laboriosa]|uniref:Uncharacterized protein n=1 Tax=Habropoda laboriosa TaxID=597456 RepID=A0A0L7QR78_9HYME|nr:hypothetical protein WH47_04398 [Habropoda laboriosa]